MADHEDFLDHTGRTPREFGSVHIYVEPVVRAPSCAAVATVWLQSAFEPLLTTDTLHVVAILADKNGELSLQRLSLPDLSGGKVVRWSLPLSLLSQDVSSKRHAARALPPGFVAPVQEGTPEPLDAPRAEVVWSPGSPLPNAVLALPPTPRTAEEPSRPTRGLLRTCYSCGFEGPLSEHERARLCPRCDAGWY
ncbi:hypothetical protein POL68_01515 [Stigmatella sp. ncwal1]|uniref:Uncharacterized protein n=1 Tax=Stigmatella ashevillensis TaxID=2995309 RepID=A0ABT5D0E5_9BACT|nr:hypothetical protein [Stigmatella ashevillena]MDC0707137.1 hypothetical protein [Stigmatella ashevillena]